MNRIFNNVPLFLILIIALTACSEGCIGTYDATQNVTFADVYIEADGNYTNYSTNPITPPNFGGVAKYTPTLPSTDSPYTYPYGQWYDTGVGVSKGDNFSISTSGIVNYCTVSFTDTINPSNLPNQLYNSGCQLNPSMANTTGGTSTLTVSQANGSPIIYNTYYNFSSQPIYGGDKIFLEIPDSGVTSCGGSSYMCFNYNNNTPSGNNNPTTLGNVFTGGQGLVVSIADVTSCTGSSANYHFKTTDTLTISNDGAIVSPYKNLYILNIPSYVPSSNNNQYLLSYLIAVPIGTQYSSGSYTINGFVRPSQCEQFNGENLKVLIMSANPNDICVGSSDTCNAKFVANGGTLLPSTKGQHIPYLYSNTSGTSGHIWARYEDPDNNYANNVDNYKMHIYTKNIPQSFSAFMNFIISPVQASLEQAITSIWISWVTSNMFQTIIKSMLTLYVVVYSIMFMFAMVEDNLRDFVGRLVRIGIIMALISCTSWTFFNKNLFAFFFVQHSSNVTASCNSSNGECTSVVLPSLSGSAPIVNTTNKSGIDVLISILTGGTASNNANTFAFIDQVFSAVFNKYTFLRILGLLFSSYIGPVLSIFLLIMAYSYLVVFIDLTITYIFSMIGIAFLISMGPLFIIAMLFSTTRQFFDNWLKLLIYFGLVPVLYIATLYVLNEIIMILLYAALNYDLCWNCVLNISIPSLGNLFCVYWWTLQSVNGQSYPFMTMVFAILTSILVAFIMIKLFWSIPTLITTIARQSLGMLQAPQIAGIIMKQATMGALKEKYDKAKQALNSKKEKQKKKQDETQRAEDNREKAAAKGKT